MYEDADLLPITCPRCHNEFEEQIGGLRDKLRRGHRILCPDCGLGIYTNREEFERLLALKRAKGGCGA